MNFVLTPREIWFPIKINFYFLLAALLQWNKTAPTAFFITSTLVGIASDGYTVENVQTIYHFVCQKCSHFCVLSVDIDINSLQSLLNFRKRVPTRF